jgi:GTP-binding protein
MNIQTASFMKGVVGEDDILEDGLPQVAFIGRSNVGKSSVITSLLGGKAVAHSSPTPGLTKVLNIFLINRKMYLVDLPGYGFAQGSKDDRQGLKQLIDWYFFEADIEQKTIVVIVDAKVGVTDLDKEMLQSLAIEQKNVLVLANKIDKLKPNELAKQLKSIRDAVSPYEVLPYSAVKKTGTQELIQKIFA